MKVFVVILDDIFDGTEIVGVYDSQYKANEERMKFIKDGYEKEYVWVESWDVE